MATSASHKLALAADVPLTMVAVHAALAAAGFPKDCTVPNDQFVHLLPLQPDGLKRDPRGVYLTILCCNVRPTKG